MGRWQEIARACGWCEPQQHFPVRLGPQGGVARASQHECGPLAGVRVRWWCGCPRNSGASSAWFSGALCAASLPKPQSMYDALDSEPVGWCHQRARGGGGRRHYWLALRGDGWYAWHGTALAGCRLAMPCVSARILRGFSSSAEYCSAVRCCLEQPRKGPVRCVCMP